VSENKISDDEKIAEGQPLVSHLVELRSRILSSLGAILVLFLPLFYLRNPIYTYVSAPLKRYLPEGASMIATGVASPFLTPFKLTLFLAIFAAIPFILHQVWSFVAPGLYSSEKRIAYPLLISSVILFYCGMAFAFYVVFPLVFSFFTSVAPTDVEVMTDINSYLDFVLKLFFAFGLAFEIPIATMVLVWTGITDVDSLRKKRPFVIVGCFVFGMLLTPPDVISQILLALPMWLLFEGGIIFSKILGIEDGASERRDQANRKGESDKGETDRS
jgi:sec-independent protein translocase protein TatC